MPETAFETAPSQEGKGELSEMDRDLSLENLVIDQDGPLVVHSRYRLLPENNHEGVLLKTNKGFFASTYEVAPDRVIAYGQPITKQAELDSMRSYAVPLGVEEYAKLGRPK